jgi:hypothetical protein
MRDQITYEYKATGELRFLENQLKSRTMFRGSHVQSHMEGRVQRICIHFCAELSRLYWWFHREPTVEALMSVCASATLRAPAL